MNTKQTSRSHKAKRITSRVAIILIVASALLTLAVTNAFMDAPVTGAIYTTDAGCTGVNINIFSSQSAVYLDGGPANPNGSGLPDGEYYVKVTEPNGVLLGTSVGAADETPAVVVGGEFQLCYQLSAILIKNSDSTPGYDATTNGGGEYKVWVSKISTFDNSETKTDNFKVKVCTEDCENDPPPPQGTINIIKFYDANANGLNDDGQLINGWRMRIQDNIDFIRFTPVSIIVDAPDTYTVTESDPVETNWSHTTPAIVIFPLADAETKTITFGNLCFGAGGGLTLGFWSNKNGQAKMNDGQDNDGPELAMLNALCLRNAAGTDVSFPNYTQFRTWLLNASATNMAYMLSAQLAAMKLNVEAGNVSGTSIIYAPGTPSANSLGYASINAVIADAESALCADGLTLSDDPNRTVQEAIKNALDKANNNLNFVQTTPCPFTFAP